MELMGTAGHVPVPMTCGESITRVLNDTKLRNRMVDASHRMAISRFRESEMLDAYHRDIRNLIHRPLLHAL